MRMTTSSMVHVLGWIAGLFIIGGLAYYFFRGGGNGDGEKVHLDLESEDVEGELSLKIIRDFFKSLNLKKGVHIPFIAKGNSAEFITKISEDSIPAEKEGYTCIIAGVYEDHIISMGKIFYAKGIDSNLAQIFDKESIVVLS